MKCWHAVDIDISFRAIFAALLGQVSQIRRLSDTQTKQADCKRNLKSLAIWEPSVLFGITSSPWSTTHTYTEMDCAFWRTWDELWGSAPPSRFGNSRPQVWVFMKQLYDKESSPCDTPWCSGLKNSKLWTVIGFLWCLLFSCDLGRTSRKGQSFD